MTRLRSRQIIGHLAARGRALLLLALCFSLTVSPALPQNGGREIDRAALLPAENEEPFERPEARLEWFMYQRTYPEPSPSLPGLMRSNSLRALKVQSLLLDALRPFAFFDPRWRAIGPLPIKSNIESMSPTTGRLGAVAVSPADPRVVLVGGAAGGIWLSTDAGNNFIAVADNQTDVAVETFAFARSEPLTVYAGMGDATGGYMGHGVLKSTDGGRNWAKTGLPGRPNLPFGAVSRVLVDPTDARRVYITEFNRLDQFAFPSSDRDGFRLSTDGGDTWSELKKVGLPRDLVMHPTDNRTLYLSMTQSPPPDAPAAVYKSTDGGESWSPIFVPPFMNTIDLQLAVTPAEPETVYLLSGGVFNPVSGCGLFNQVDLHLLVSKNGGRDWTNLGTPREVDKGSFGRKTYIAVDPKNAQTIYIGTHDLFKSTDGGMTWRNLTNNYRSNGSGGFVFDPRGDSFEPKGVGASVHGDQHVFAFSADSNVIYIGHDGGLSRSEDGGSSFESLNGSLPLAQLNNITAHPTDPGILYAGTQDNGALIRQGGAMEWREFIAGDSGGCVIDPGDSTVVIANYVQGILNRFRNNGEVQDSVSLASNATFLENNPCPRIAFYPPFISDRSGKLYFGTWQLFVSSDRGNSWQPTALGTDLTKGTAGERPDVLTAIAVSPSQSEVIYTGSSHGRAMVSRDGGRSWRDITSGLVNRFIKSITVAPTDPDTAYITFSGFKAGGHVFKTTDGGASWTNISGGLHDTPVNALLIDPLDQNIIYIGTDVGVFRLTVNSRFWEPFNSGLPAVPVTGFAVRSDNTIQLATFGRGAYELAR